MFHVLVHQRSRSKPYLNLCLLAHSNIAKITLCAFHGTVSSEIFSKLSYALCMCMHEEIIELALSAPFQEILTVASNYILVSLLHVVSII